MQRNQGGFSLIELLVVCAIILVLAGIIVPSIVSSLQTANETSAANTLKQVANAQQQYHSLYNVYAPTAAMLGGVASATGCPSIPLATGACQINNGIALLLDGGTLSSYNFKYTLVDPQNWSLSATPSSSYSGRKAYFIAPDGTVTYQAYASGMAAMTAPGTPLGQ